ncbi:MAG: hypothetical protein H6733_13610 [Alphaproteobacteria bacterium]|nr:hypothetical protein [Alphaproteobacteria bacterium]
MASWEFNSLGGVDQMRLANTEDLEHLATLDKARWAATSVPTSQLYCDPAFLGYVDSDANGRLRVLELRAAQAWTWQRLANRERVIQGSDELALADLDTTNADATRMKALAEHVIAQAGGTPGLLPLVTLRGARAAYAKSFPNGDGVIIPDHAGDDGIKALVEAVVAVTGGATDVSGAAGTDTATLDTWAQRVADYAAWHARAVDDAASVLPLGDGTAAAAALVQRLAPKMTQYFAQCALVAAASAADERLRTSAEELAALDVRDPAAIGAWLADAPLAEPRADATLDLTGRLNPTFRADLEALARDVAPKALGKDTVTALDAGDWSTLMGFVQPWLAWQAARPAGIAADADPAALQALAASDAVGGLRERITADLAVADELKAFADLEKLIVYQRWLAEVARNMVSFIDLFDPDKRSLFEAGTLVLDGRKLTLCHKVEDAAGHKKIATDSLVFVAYVDLVRNDAGTVKTGKIAAGVTAGTRGGIALGKRGVFYDRDGAEWDAIVVDLITQPISVWEAMIAPFTRLRDMVADRISQFAGSKATALEAEAAAGTDKATTVPAAAPAKDDGGGGMNMQTLLIGGSIAVAAIGSTLAFIAQTLANIDPLTLFGGLAAVILLLMAVSGFLGWLKLRRRDIGTLLEACGWALNARMTLTFALGSQFTIRPGLPKGAVRRLTAAQKRTRVIVVVVVLALLGLGAWLAMNPEVLDGLKPSPPEPAAEAAPAPDAAPAP